MWVCVRFYDGFLIFDLYSTIFFLTSLYSFAFYWWRSVLSPYPFFSCSKRCNTMRVRFIFPFYKALLLCMCGLFIWPVDAFIYSNAKNFKAKNSLVFDLKWKKNKIAKKSSMCVSMETINLSCLAISLNPAMIWYVWTICFLLSRTVLLSSHKFREFYFLFTFYSTLYPKKWVDLVIIYDI